MAHCRWCGRLACWVGSQVRSYVELLPFDMWQILCTVRSEHGIILTFDVDIRRIRDETSQGSLLMDFMSFRLMTSNVEIKNVMVVSQYYYCGNWQLQLPTFEVRFSKVRIYSKKVSFLSHLDNSKLWISTSEST